MCAAPKNNQFWKQRSKHGRNKLFATPELLWQAACEYFEHCDKNPWKRTKKKRTVKGIETEESPAQRPYTLAGFMIYIGVNRGYWSDFKKLVNEDFSEVMTRIEQIIETQQLEGAMVGAFNPNIVARLIGLIDKQELSGEVKTGLTVIVESKEDAELLEQMKKK